MFLSCINPGLQSHIQVSKGKVYKRYVDASVVVSLYVGNKLLGGLVGMIVFLPSLRALPSFVQDQIVLVDNRGTNV